MKNTMIEQPKFNVNAVLADQVATWSAEIARLQALVAHATGLKPDEANQRSVVPVMKVLQALMEQTMQRGDSALVTDIAYALKAVETAKRLLSHAKFDTLELRRQTDLLVPKL